MVLKHRMAPSQSRVCIWGLIVDMDMKLAPVNRVQYKNQQKPQSVFPVSMISKKTGTMITSLVNAPSVRGHYQHNGRRINTGQKQQQENPLFCLVQCFNTKAKHPMHASNLLHRPRAKTFLLLPSDQTTWYLLYPVLCSREEPNPVNVFARQHRYLMSYVFFRGFYYFVFFFHLFNALFHSLFTLSKYPLEKHF